MDSTVVAISDDTTTEKQIKHPKDSTDIKVDESGLEDLNSFKRFEFCNYLSFNDCIHYYELWSKFYDTDAKQAKYNGPACTIKHVPRFISDGKAKLLDICAGTGACAIDLQKHGYNNVDALDGCKNMLSLAQSRGLYKSYFLNYLEPGIETSIPSSIYDGVICAGGFVNGHLKAEVCQEFARFLKPGGICIIGMREAFLHTVDEYRNRLEPFMDAMTEWKLIEKINEPNWFGNLEGIVFVYQRN